jgi:hypothetical protein
MISVEQNFIFNIIILIEILSILLNTFKTNLNFKDKCSAKIEGRES